MKGLWMCVGKSMVNEAFRCYFFDPNNTEGARTNGMPEGILERLPNFLQEHEIPCSRFCYGEINRLITEPSDTVENHPYNVLSDFFNALDNSLKEQDRILTPYDYHAAIGLSLIDPSFKNELKAEFTREFPLAGIQYLKKFGLYTSPKDAEYAEQIISHSDFDEYSRLFRRSWERPAIIYESPGACSPGATWNENIKHIYDLEVAPISDQELRDFLERLGISNDDDDKKPYVIFTKAPLENP